MKNHILIYPVANYTDVGGGNIFVNSVSEPVSEREARRMMAAVGCKAIGFNLEGDAATASVQGQEQMTTEAHEAHRKYAPEYLSEADLASEEARMDELSGFGPMGNSVENGSNPDGGPVSGLEGQTSQPKKAASSDAQQGVPSGLPVRSDVAKTPTGLPATKTTSSKSKA